MQKLLLEVTPDEAAEVLKDTEAKIQAERAALVALGQRISGLEKRAAMIRDMLHGMGVSNGTSSRPRGSNRQLIVDFLKTVQYARPIDIFKATGIPKSSVPFTLRQHPDTFEYDAAHGVWKLKQ